MYQFILKNKRLLISLFLVLIFSVAGQANQNENIPQRTAEMLRTLESIERVDFQSDESGSLIQEIFSNKKYQKQAGPMLNEFFLSEKNFAGKRYFMNELKKAGTPAAMNYLAELLTIDPSAELALMTLQGIPGESVNKLLRNSFSKASPKIKPGIISALGLRKDESSVSFISKFIGDEDPVISGAAVSALGKIGTSKASDVLTKALKSAGLKDQFPLMEALLENAEQLVSDNQSGRANELYYTVLAVNPPEMIALAAIKGKMNTTSGNAVDILKEELISAPDEFKPRLVDLVRTLPESYLSGQEFLQLPGIPDNEKARMMVVLSDRNDKSIFNEVLQFLDHEEPLYRESAISSLSKIAGVENIPLLAELASVRSGKEQELAREGIYRLPGQDIDSFILQKAAGSENESLLVEYIKAIGERDISSAGQVLVRTANNENQDVRLESYRTLAKVGTSDHLGEMINLLLKTGNSRERQELERAVVLVSTKEGPEKPITNEIVTWLNKTPETDKKAILISVLGSLKNPDDLNVLQTYLGSEDTDLQLSAIRALLEWPNAGPAAELKEIIGKSDDLRIKTLALRGFTRIISNDESFSDEKKAQELSFAMIHAPNVNEKKLVISAFGKIHSNESLRLLADQMADDENPRAELEAAILNMTPELIKQDREHTIEQLKRVMEYSDNDEIRKWTE